MRITLSAGPDFNAIIAAAKVFPSLNKVHVNQPRFDEGPALEVVATDEGAVLQIGNPAAPVKRYPNDLVVMQAYGWQPYEFGYRYAAR